MDRLDWLERAGIENLKMRVENADLFRKEANTLRALMLSGAGAALYFAAKETDLRKTAWVVSCWLFVVALILTWKCLSFSDYPSIWNEPKNLNNKNFQLDELRQFELINIQTKIEQAIAINKERTKWHNRCITLACLTPLVAFIGWFF